MTAAVTAKLPLKQARLHYTADTGLLSKRRWEKVDANIAGKSIRATVPKEATVWVLTVTDSRGAMVSTPPMFSTD